MKNKLLSIFVLVVMMFSMIGCGLSNNASSEGQNQSATSTDETVESGLKVGYCVNYMSHEWYQNICDGAEERAKELGVELIFADANNDAATQISQCENLLASGIDVLIVTPVDNKVLGNIITQANELGIPVITESNMVEGADTLVGIDNITSGKLAGAWLAEYATEQGFTPNVLIVGAAKLADCNMRVEGFIAGLEESGIEYVIAQEVDSDALKEKSVERSTDALTAHPEINTIFGINDDATTGAIQAYKASGLDESKLTSIGFGFEGAVGQQALLSGGSYKAALAMFPNYVGVSLIDAAVQINNGETLPEHYETPTVIIEKENFNQFYNEDGDKYSINFDAVRAISKQ